MTRGFTLVAALLGGPSALARIDDDVRHDVPPAPLMAIQNRIHMDAAQLERRIFTNGLTGSQNRARSERQLGLQIEEIDRICSLDKVQKKKLDLAGKGESKHFFDEVNGKFLEIDRKNPNVLLGEILPLRNKFAAGFFGPGSFYHRTVKNVLDAEPFSKCQAASQNREAYAINAKLEVIFGLMDGGLGFHDNQREQLFEILRKEIPVPNIITPLTFTYTYYCMAQISEDLLKPIFDDSQWRLLTLHLKRHKGMKKILEANGYRLPEPKLAAKPLNPTPPRQGNSSQ